MALPIQPVTKPSTIRNYENGKLPSSVLALVGVGSARMEVTAARAAKAMFAQARKDLGVEIKHVGDYRSFEAQLSLFLSRYKPVSYNVYINTSSAHRKRWYDAGRYGYDSQYWVKKDNRLATAAVPGSSNHGWGLALDIAEEYDGDAAADPITSRFVNWLVQNAAKYGFSAELQSEPWHWRYFAGDAVPRAVLEFEAGTEPDPTPNPPPTTGGKFTVLATREEVKLGSSGHVVERLQATLAGVWNQTVGPIDGQFGPLTETGVRNAQAWANAKGWASPPLKVDGICGPKTWAVIENYPNDQNP